MLARTEYMRAAIMRAPQMLGRSLREQLTIRCGIRCSDGGKRSRNVNDSVLAPRCIVERKHEQSIKIGPARHRGFFCYFPPQCKQMGTIALLEHHARSRTQAERWAISRRHDCRYRNRRKPQRPSGNSLKALMIRRRAVGTKRVPE